MNTCVRCGAALGVGRFCLNCGHRIGDPAPVEATPVEATPLAPAPEPAAAEPPAAAPAPRDAVPVPVPDSAPEPVALPVQAADPTAVAPATAPLGAPVEPAPVPVPAPPAPRAPVRESTWDPREELLPYEEVDELVDDPVRGRAWIFWVLGAVLLVGLVFVLLDAFAADEDDTPATDPSASASSAPAGGGAEESTQPEAGEDGAEGPTGVGKRVDLARAATVEVPGTAPPTTDFDGNLVAYEAVQMHDGDPRTTWRVEGDATGQVVTFTLAEPAVVDRVGLVNGYAKQVAGVDWYPNNRRILAVTWGFEDGTTVEQTFSEQPTMQLLKVTPVQTSTVTITITSVTPPGSGSLGRDYTAISEVAVTGRRAG
ncbi:NADase-type glycan-binding domain-containing protein [Nocardioides baculatus]|uniref:NAD glycohydrolase translocation F5/8 type C domain-containing protein n=1 Tax=Nocardioides baculatus TaxID=2801337 RepID=A0ABS1L735_9ACTN|nr:hypothetical protein [Nocardioides baculatus]MBL0747499.1 hypothetical protein [Nocardioides baculatus]